MRQNRKFHSKALVNVFLPKLMNRRSRVAAFEGKEAVKGGARRLAGTR